jgi:hypothetical protein
MLHFRPAGLLRLRQYSSTAALKEHPSVPLHSSSNWVARDPATRPLGLYENTPVSKNDKPLISFILTEYNTEETQSCAF